MKKKMKKEKTVAKPTKSLVSIINVVAGFYSYFSDERGYSSDERRLALAGRGCEPRPAALY